MFAQILKKQKNIQVSWDVQNFYENLCKLGKSEKETNDQKDENSLHCKKNNGIIAQKLSVANNKTHNGSAENSL